MNTRSAQRPALGITLVVVMALLFSGMDTSIRALGSALPVLLMLTARYLFQALLMAVWLGVGPSDRLRTRHPRFQALRGSLLLACSAMSFIGLQHMPVAEFTSISMLTPVLVTLLAAWLLHERVSPLRWALVVGAAIGALTVIRPGSGLFGWVVLFPLTGALSFAAFQLLTRRLSSLEDPLTTHFWTGLIGTAVLLPMLLASPIDIGQVLSDASAGQCAMLLLIGALGTFGHLLLILALGLAPTSTLMPFAYLQIAWASLLGWLVFDHLPDGWGWLGMTLIAACGAASAWLNLRPGKGLNKPPATALPAAASVTRPE